MSKKVTVELRVPVRVRDRDMRLLAHVDELSAAGPAEVSLADLARGLGCALDTARRAARSCAQEGYLGIEHVHREDGGQVANRYELTELGRRVLAAAKETGVA